MNAVFGAAHQRINELKNSMLSAITAGALPKIDAPLEHYFASGLYGRRIYVPAGSAVVTKIHMVQHIAIAIKGTCTVFAQDGSKTIVSAPDVFITEPGTQRAIYCHDDVEWITVHATNLQDTNALERKMTCDTFEEYADRKDYEAVLIETGWTEKQAREISENKQDQSFTDADSENYYLAPSKLEGIGVFAKRDFSEKEIIGFGLDGTLRTQLGRYANHSHNPNMIFEMCNNSVQGIACKAIKKDEEITVNYRQVYAFTASMRALS